MRYKTDTDTERLILPIPLNLTFFNDGGGEKTETATPRKRQKARSEGQVRKSQELSIAVLLIAAFMGLRVFGGHLFGFIFNTMRGGLGFVGNMDFEINAQTLGRFIAQGFGTIILAVLPMFLIVLAVGILVNLIQVGWHPTAKPLMPKLNKLSPIKGFKKIFSMRTIVELVKSLLKLGILVSVIYIFVMNEQESLPVLLRMDLYAIVVFVGDLVVNVGLMIGFLYLFIAGLDFVYQQWKHEKDLRMSKQEVKEEWKQTEGNPEIKGAIRRKMRQVSMRRMMQAVPGADVIITNPTHYAVALKYNRLTGDAPVVVAKGVDYVAKRIRENAESHNVEVVENKPLARTLYETVDVGREIPPELFQAVAEVFMHLVRIGKVAMEM